MVNIALLHVGDKVRIVDKPKGPSWNKLMDKYLGAEMTVRSVGVRFRDRILKECCSMEEDMDDPGARDCEQEGWLWYSHMIEYIVSDKDMPDAQDIGGLF